MGDAPDKANQAVADKKYALRVEMLALFGHESNIARYAI